ncbi:U1 small nuclear ribonucleoprotein 70kDa [Cryptococcus gattii Ru294]|uniref:U1 snRNP 70K protein (Short form), putative n=2 Tax=Cryptococcus gattii TaxID=37769 RepID=E6R018_CRYGW|nr:U1 snRNP 70K protein (short form), putative [Cryptococcus gattii WM276]ADV20185.1 U1 snRNP 70K protein (short form), putative [Cryptococcus gattii WM276]KIR55835.1 U1 small nuclear ribonucleoprotein 70kDa [Cryptococcus gattii Ru294]KIR77342.1 U1 small nuclear ribonucleoprotein 70kDa [Cryptococcus gattii EJB2]KIY36351.1 U1 small nuclear ribonucleoprotein 70kDa [Cryptococcus gattii E566]
MSHLLPPNLLKLFAPRPQPPFLKPLTRDERIRGPNNLGGVAGLAKRIKEEAEDAEVKQGMDLNPEKALDEQKEENVKTELKQDGEDGEVAEDSGKDRKKKTARDKIAEMGIIGEEAVKLRKELRKKRQEEYKKSAEANYKPQDDAQAIGDPYKTLFISRLSKKANETDLRREFEMYGPIERIRIVRNRKGKSNGYAFIVYERERDMKAAYKDAEGIPIHHKKILVDVERGRTVKGWKPQRLGGGLGGRPKPVVPEAAPAPYVAPSNFRGGRGGFRGGGRGGGGGGGFRGGFQGGRGGFGGGNRGGFGGGDDRGGFGGRGGFRGGFQNRGDRGPGGFGQQGGFGGPGGPGAPGGYGGQGGGYGGGGGGGGGGLGGPGQQNGYQGGQGGGGFGGGGGYKRDYDNAGGPGGYGGGGGGGGFGGGSGGYQDRDPKRMRY